MIVKFNDMNYILFIIKCSIVFRERDKYFVNMEQFIAVIIFSTLHNITHSNSSLNDSMQTGLYYHISWIDVQ